LASQIIPDEMPTPDCTNDVMSYEPAGHNCWPNSLSALVATITDNIIAANAATIFSGISMSTFQHRHAATKWLGDSHSDGTEQTVLSMELTM